MWKECKEGSDSPGVEMVERTRNRVQGREGKAWRKQGEGAEENASMEDVQERKGMLKLQVRKESV